MHVRSLYLVLAVLGAIVPYLFFVQHFREAGYGLNTFVHSIFANGAASGFTADLLITSLVFWIAIIRDRQKNSGPHPAPFIALNLLIGLSCALPAWLYARSKDED